jgi:hypothetical protein
VGWKDKLVAKAADAAKTGLEQAKNKVENENATSRLRALIEMREDQPITIEALLVLLVDAVHEDDPRELSQRDVKKAGKRRQRLAGGLGMLGGPVGTYVASLYSEAVILCDVADRHGLGLSDEELAAQLLVMWNAVPDADADAARAAIDGSGPSVAIHMATGVYERLADTPVDQMTKKDAVMALWRLRSMVAGASLPGSASPKDVLLPGGRVKALIKAAERQLGVARGPLFGGPSRQPTAADLAAYGASARD